MVTFSKGIKSRYTAFYAIHNRMKEFDLNVQCFNRSHFLTNNFDVIVNCNDKNSFDECLNISKNLNTKNLTIIFDEKNEGGYMMGPMEQAANSFHKFLEYDLIAQIHADVYLMKDFALKSFIESYEKGSVESNDFYAFPMPNRDHEYAYDFWLMRPSEASNIFKNWKEVQKIRQPTASDPKRTQGEAYIADMVIEMNLKMGHFDRSPCAGMTGQYESSSGILHTHNFNHALRVFEETK